MRTRTDLPGGGRVIKYSDGEEYWFNQNGMLHRLDGPAIERSNGTKYWYQNGKRHRIDGPAVEYPDGLKEWFFFGKFFIERKRQ